MEETSNSVLIGKNSLFWSPDYLDISAWLEHIPFAFWLVEVLKPKILVELGVHNGPSYFAFCQAVKALNIDTACYGIDTWKGDEHSGHYDDAVFGKVSGYNALHYSRFSTLIRSSFDEAREYFVDQSIELLHIDGLHTYEAVKHDFDTWLPKLSPDAFVLFHDINVRERQFGVFELWEELKARYEYLHFDFGHGLGVIALGRIHSADMKSLFSFNRNEGNYLFLRNLFAERGAAFKSTLDHSLSLQKEQNAVRELQAAQSQATENYKTLEVHYLQLISERKTYQSDIELLRQTIDSMEINQKILQEKINVLNMQHAVQADKYETLAVTNGRLQESRDSLQHQLSQLTVANRSISDTRQQLEKTFRELEMASQQLQEKNTDIENQLQGLKRQLESAELSNGLLAKTQLEAIASLTASLEKGQAELDILQSSNIELKSIIESQQQGLQWYKNTYENRSILGIFRENLKRRLRKARSGSQEI